MTDRPDAKHFEIQVAESFPRLDADACVALTQLVYGPILPSFSPKLATYIAGELEAEIVRREQGVDGTGRMLKLDDWTDAEIAGGIQAVMLFLGVVTLPITDEFARHLNAAFCAQAAVRLLARTVGRNQ